MQVKPKKFYTIKRYENYLKRSVDSTILTQVEQLTPCLTRNRVSYQFRHFQLKIKSSNSKNFVKKISLGHLVSADSSQLSPELKFKKYNIALKKQNESFGGGLCCVKKGKHRSLVSTVSLITQKNSEIRPKSVLLSLNGRRTNIVKGLSSDNNQADFELAPW